MDMGAITTLIGSVGFPIAMCVIIFLDSRHREELHDAEVAKLSENIANNTLVLQKLLDKMNS